MFKKLKALDFKAEFIVARKDIRVFIKRHKKQENLFYYDMISKLLKNRLHKEKETVIYFSKRSNKNHQQYFEHALQAAKIDFENKWDTEIENQLKFFIQTPTDEPCLQIIDYMNWAVYRALTKKNTRYLDTVNEKLSLLA